MISESLPTTINDCAPRFAGPVLGSRVQGKKTGLTITAVAGSLGQGHVGGTGREPPRRLDLLEDLREAARALQEESEAPINNCTAEETRAWGSGLRV